MSDCIFCKIAAGQLPSGKVYEDADVLAFHDIHPFARVHFLIIPKAHVATLSDCLPEHQALLGKMLLLAPRLAKEQGLDTGFKTQINTNHNRNQEENHNQEHEKGKNEPVRKS